MKIDAHSILLVLSVSVVLSYMYNYLASAVRIPAVLLLILTGVGLKIAADVFQLQIPETKMLLEILGVTGLIFIVLEASLELHIAKEKLPLIWKALLSAVFLSGVTSLICAAIFMAYFDIDFRRAMLHAIPLSIISSAIAIPSVARMAPQKKEFVVYESTFSDILGILIFNFFLIDHESGLYAITNFGVSMILIGVISVISTLVLLALLNHTTSHIRFILIFAVIILAYSIAKYWHLPALLLVLCFGLALTNISQINVPALRRFVSFEKLANVSQELKVMTGETAFVIRTFFFLVFGYSMNLRLLQSQEVLITGVAIIIITVLLRFLFLRQVLGIVSTPLALIAPRGLITILLFYSIPDANRVEQLSEGVLFIVIGVTSVMMAIGLLMAKQRAVLKDAV
jgi:Kef-type K+ transport system membrane component KefB